MKQTPGQKPNRGPQGAESAGQRRPARAGTRGASANKMPALSRQRVTTLIVAAIISFVVLGGVSVSRSTTVAAAGQPYSFNFLGTPTAPQSVVPATWDVQIHKRDQGDYMESMNAQHGTNCGAPPATHAINTLAQGVFICNNHLMTAIGDSGYGEIALTPDHMADWSTGTVAIKVDVSTLQFNTSDFVEIWVSPFADNQTLPFEDNIIDNQGPLKTALAFSFNASGLLGTHEGDVSRFDNFQQTDLPRTSAQQTLASLALSSPTIRTTYEIDISQGHVRFGLPAQNVWWTDTNISPLSFSQGIVQITHHSYNPLKHDPGTGIDSWHWSNFSISNAVPFAILNGAERSINAGGATTVHFPAPAPANAYLRFSGLGPVGSTYTVSYDGGVSWVSPALQNQIGPIHDEHFSTYWTPVPAGTQTVMFQGKAWWGGAWWVRDPAIWAQGSATPPLPTAPSVTSLAPSNGPTAGGTSVTIAGTNLTGATAVNFGTAAATTFAVSSATQIKATSPAGSGNVDVTVTNAAGTSATTPADVFAFTSPPGAYTAQSPNRILDTRTSGQTLTGGVSLNLTVAGGTTGVPATATGVVLNVTATNTSAPSFLTVWPAGSPRATVSSLNWAAGETRPNLVNVSVGAGGQVSIYNSAGSADVVVDEEGYFAAPVGTAGGYNSLSPARLLDTRSSGQTMGTGSTIDLPILGAGGLPASGVSAVVLNVTATNTSTAGFFTVFPSLTTRPTASNVNWAAGWTVPNRVIVKVGTNGSVSIYNSQGLADVVIDVSGYFTDSSTSGKFFTQVSPVRILDTRGSGGSLGPTGTYPNFQVTGNNGVPSGATAVFLNATVTNTTAPSFLTTYPGVRPTASDLNWVAGQTIPNLTLATLNSSGATSFYNAAGGTDLVLDLSGWFS
jgi:IPT/TIG domain